MKDELPPDIVETLEFLAMMAKGYDNHLKWNEEARLKADLMNNRRYWLGFSAEAVRAKACELGMRSEDAALVYDLVSRAQAGKRLVADRTYRDFKFPHDRPARTDLPNASDGPFGGGQDPNFPHSRDW